MQSVDLENGLVERVVSLKLLGELLCPNLREVAHRNKRAGAVCRNAGSVREYESGLPISVMSRQWNFKTAVTDHKICGQCLKLEKRENTAYLTD
eukprot:IDg22221t1